jgi:hypothetical protein
MHLLERLGVPEFEASLSVLALIFFIAAVAAELSYYLS